MNVSVVDGKNISEFAEGPGTPLILGPDTAVLSGVPTNSDLDTRGRPLRIVAYPNETLPFTHFSDVKLSGIRGLAFEEITVEFEISQGPVS